MLRKKWFLFLTAFFSGMSVMAIELGASRLLAPYFSSSQIVWTIIIGIIMIAMAIGNVIGGKIADKTNNLNRLFIFIFSAAVWTGLIPLVSKYIIAGVALLCALVVKTNFIIIASTISCLLIFVYPLLVLGMVTPSLLKFAVSDNEESGKTCGIIEALGTIGSIIGTFLPTFVTIPNIGTALTFILFSSVLLIICLIYLIITLKKRKDNLSKKTIIKTTAASIAGILVLSTGFLSNNISAAFWKSNVLYEDESIYNYLRVEETEDAYILSTNVLFGIQSIKMKNGGLTNMYYDYALAAPILANALNEEIDILILGLGTGTFSTQCFEYFNNVNIDGVEIDEKIVKVAYEYFSLSDKVNVAIEDGRAFLQQSKKTYDVIMVDAYQDITIPFQMSSIEFFSEVYEHLNEDGVMVVNMNMYSKKEGGINDYLSSTIKHVFPYCYTANIFGNCELFASKSFDIKEKLDAEIPNIPQSDLKYKMYEVSRSLQEYTSTKYLLTDDKAPVEVLGNEVLDELIQQELAYYKNLINGKSLKELFDMLLSGELF